MRILLASLLGISLAANQALALTNRVDKAAPSGTATNSAVHLEYLKILAEDDAAQKEADQWIRDNQKFAEQGAGLAHAALRHKVEHRMVPVRKLYEDFIQKHPEHLEARLAYGSFLNDMQEPDEAAAIWEKARELAPHHPSAWNNLANHYGHFGSVKKAFVYYEKAIELDPKEPVYLQNLATTTYLFRKDAREHYNLTEEQVFDRALSLYRKAIELDPNNLVLATDLAQSYYGIKPLRSKEAIDAWKYALKLADDPVEKEGIYLHLARVELNSGLFDEARRHLALVKDDTLLELKKRLERNLIDKENKARSAQPAS